MKTITFDENLKISKNHFKNLDDFQTHIVEELQNDELSEHHKIILDERIIEANKNPENYITLNELKSSIKRK